MAEKGKKKTVPEQAAYANATVSQREEEILTFWRENKIFEKSLEQRAGADTFVFYDGPPFATGLPHYGHILASIIKDVVPRYQTMRGKFVPRRWGWDCHGLPLENIIERELGLQHKKDIEAYGIAKFNKEAERAVLRYADDWKKIIPRIGRWADMEHDYRTMDWSYTESVWQVFKTLHEKGFVYEGYKSMHICPRCETTLANFEVSQGYKEVTDISVTVKFELEEEPAGTFMLAWTTTPWTLPGNAALAVNDKIVYAKCKVQSAKLKVAVQSSKLEEAYYIVAKERIREVFFDGEYEIVEEFLGSELVGKKYKPLFDYYSSDEKLENHGNGWKIYAADFVSTDEGTGIVHIAPAFGADDMQLGKEQDLPFIQHVGMDGAFRPDVKDFAGLPVKPKEDHQKTDVEIIKYLAHPDRNLLFSKKKITHSYPFCWRCETPLLNYAATSWFVDVTQFKGKLQKTAQEISWVPAHLKEGRFGRGLDTAPDWAISRARFWGAPIPVWKCTACEEEFAAGSLEDLETRRVKKPNTYYILRHGEREDIPHHKDNPKDYGPVIISSDPLVDIHISEKGKEGIRAVAQELKQQGGVDVIISSDFIRAKETAVIISEVLGVAVAYDKRLRELNHGPAFEGGTVDEYWNYFADSKERFTKAPEGGETLHDVTARVMAVAREFERAHEGKRVLLISHGDPLWMLESALQNRTEEETLAARECYIKQGELREVYVRNWPYDEEGRLNMHRPYIDEITLRCMCGGTMKRIPEVFDCWFESGSMPYGQQHWMGGGIQNFPADFIAEGLDQTRGWFYALHVLASGLFEKPAFKNVLVNGIILAEDGQKMSKRLKNYPDPMDIVGKYGADALRLYLLSSPAVYAEDLNFSEKGVDDVYKKNILRLANVYAFYNLYKMETMSRPIFNESLHVLDKFILWELERVTLSVQGAIDEYKLGHAARRISEFIDMVSTVYLQYSRDRFREGADGRVRALASFRYVLVQFAKIVAPFAPFAAEYFYQQVKYNDAAESVHLEGWPSTHENTKTYHNEAAAVAQIPGVIEWILAERSKAGIPVRQPLATAWVRALPRGEEYRAIIRERANVERVEEDDTLGPAGGARIDTVLTPELKEKGMLREFIRAVQDARKKEGLQPKDGVTLRVHARDSLKVFFEKYRSEIMNAVHADALVVMQESGKHMSKLGDSEASFSLIRNSTS